MRMRRGLRVAMAAAVVVLLVVVGLVAIDRMSNDDAGGGAVAWSGTSGSPIGDVFEVVEGTRLIADPIPWGSTGTTGGVPTVSDGWFAVLTLDDADPETIVEAYLDQAAARGLTARSAVWCDPNLLVEAERCGVTAQSGDADGRGALSVSVVRGRCDGVPSNHVVLSWSPDAPVAESAPFSPGSLDQLGEADPGLWPPLAQVGDQVGPGGVMTTGVVIEEGSELAGPALCPDVLSGRGIEILIEVTGSPEAVLDAYVAQLPDESFGPPETWVNEVDGAAVTQVERNQAGGDYFVFRLVERTGRPVWLSISGHHD